MAAKLSAALPDRPFNSAARHGPMSIAAELGSTASTLDQIVERIARTADSLVGTPDEDFGIGLMDVERSLRTASRRLERLVKDMQGR